MTEQERLAAAAQMAQAYRQSMGGAAPVPPAPPAAPRGYAQNVTGYDPSNSDPNRPIYDYNEGQFADQPTADYWANRLGGQAQNADYQFFERSEPERLINYGGNESMNAGLVSDTDARYGTPGIDYADYEIARDRAQATGQRIAPTYNQYATSQPGFKMSSTLANSGPGYNYVPDGKGGFVNAAQDYAPVSDQSALATMQKAKDGGGRYTQTGAPPPTSYVQNYAANVTKKKPLSPEEFASQQSTSTVNRQSDRSGRESTSSGSYTGSARDRSERGGTSAPLEISGIRSDVNGSYSGTTTVGGQFARIAVLPDGRIFNDQGQEITNQIEPGERASIIGSFQQQSGDPSFVPSGAPINREPIDGRGQTDEQAAAAYQQYINQWNAENPGNEVAPPGDSAPPPPTTKIPTPPPSGPSYRAPGYTPSPNRPPAGSSQPPDANYSSNQSPAQNLRYRFQGQGNGEYQPYGQAPPPIYTQENGEGLQYKTENDRGLIIGRGDAIDEDLRNYTAYQHGQAADFGDRADAAYSGISQGRGGYSDAEKDSILNNDALQSLQLSGDEAQSNYLNDEERAGITGDPNRALEQLGHDEAGIDTASNTRDTKVRDALDTQSGQVRGALEGQDTAVRSAVAKQGANTRATLGGMAENVRGAYADAADNVRGSLDSGEASTRSYLDRDRLALSDEYNRDYQFGARDQQDIENRAGRTVGFQNQADEDRLLRDANAGGNTSPLALEASRNRLRQTGAVNSADAMTDARIQAKQLALTTAQNRENTRLGAEQNYANLGTGTELTLGGRRTAAEQTLAEQAQGNERYLGEAALNTEGTLGAAEIGAESYLGNQRQQAEMSLGTQKTGAEQTLGQSHVDIGTAGANRNLDAFQTADKAASDRANLVATNRQATGRANQADQLERGKYIYGQGSAVNKGFADERLKEEGEYRGYLGGKETEATQGVQVGNQQRVGNYGTQFGAQNAATGNAIRNYGTQNGDNSFGKVAGLFGLKSGGAVTGPTPALVGEDGPELVIDLSKMPRYGDGGIANPYSMGSGEAEYETYGLPTDGSPVSRRYRETPPNPLYEAIRKGAQLGGSLTGNDYTGDQQQQGQERGNVLGTAMTIGKLFGLASGGVVAGPERETVAPGIDYVNGPQVTTLGRYGAQAVVPLNRKKSNRVTPEMIPRLAEQYGSYGA